MSIKIFFNYRLHILPYINPLIRDEINRIGNYQGINTDKIRETPIIVSLTSYRERFKDLPITLYSLLNQSLKPDKIILWLDEEMEDLPNLPYEISGFIKNGLEIRFVKDIKSYTKIIYALKEFPNCIIVTADDDIYYRRNWLKKLYISYIANPNDIHVHRAHRVKTAKNVILPYKNWDKQINDESARFDNFLTGVGGVLYPPQCYTKEVLREDVFLKYAPTADDIWLWVMALTHNRKIRVVRNHYKTLLSVNVFRQKFGKTLFAKNKTGGNDTQLNALMKMYESNVKNKLLKDNN